MTDEKKTMPEFARAPQRMPGFDPMKFAREVAGKAGEKVLTLDLKHKKAWFRMACPNGGVVLNPLRVTDQMAIFEARLFADTDDRNPLASFTATRSADKATGKQYIRAAQEDALNEALENAGFGLPLVPMSNDSGQEPAPPAGQAEAMQEAAGGDQPVETQPVTEPKQVVEPVVKPAGNIQAVQTVPREAPPVQQPKSAPRPAPVGPPPRAAETPRPVPVGPQPRRTTETASGASAVVDFAAAKSPQPAAQQGQTGTVRQPAADAVAGQDAPAPVKEDAPITYTADMTVEEITRLMTLEQAKQIKVQEGACKGWTLEQIAADRLPSLKWLKLVAPFADNVLKAAAGIVLADVELKKAG